MTERLARIKAEAKTPTSDDEDTIEEVEHILASKNQEDGYGNIEDDFAGGLSEIDGSFWPMTWRSHLAELISRLREEGHEKPAAYLARLADVNSLKKPFTAADEAEVIESILVYLTSFAQEVTAT